MHCSTSLYVLNFLNYGRFKTVQIYLTDPVRVLCNIVSIAKREGGSWKINWAMKINATCFFVLQLTLPKLAESDQGSNSSTASVVVKEDR